MKNLHKLASIILLFINTSNAFVYKMELWQDEQNNSITTLSDWHQDTLGAETTFRQKKEIIDLAKQINAYGIFEDVGWYAGKNPEILKALKNTRRLAYAGQKIGKFVPAWVENKVDIQVASPLFDITEDAKKQGVDCQSIEFRYAALWAILGYKISIQDISQEISAKIKEIQDYQDGPQMKEIYNFMLESYFKNNQDFLNTLKQYAQNPKNQLASLPADKRDRVEITYDPIKNVETHNHYDRMNDYAHGILDIEILHALAQQLKAGKKMFIVYAGGDHIENIGRYGLPQMGFKLKKTIGSDAKDFHLYSKEQMRVEIRNALDIKKTYDQLIKK